MKTKKLFTTLLALVMIISIFSACSKKTDNAGSTTTPAPSAAAGATAAPTDAAPKALKGNLVIWTFFDQVKDMAVEFQKKYPDVKVDVQLFPGDQYQTKLLSALQSGQNVPDLFDLERGYIGKFVNSKYVTDMSAMGADTLLKDYIPYVKELGVSADGKIRAVSDHSSPGGFFYLREVAKKYLGTDDPDKISEMVSSWDKIIELGKEVNTKSGGKVHLIQNAGDLFDVEAYNTQPWVKDGALNIDPKWQTTYELQKKIRANNVDAKLDFMSAGWGNALNDGSAILSSMPAWAVFMIGNKDNAAAGKFGVAKTPEGFYAGGTYRAIYDKTPNKALAYEFVKFIASPEWQLHNIQKTGNAPGNGAVYEQVKDTYKSVLTGDENVMKYYYDLVKNIPATKADPYSEEVLNKWRKVASQGIKDNASYETVLASFKKEVKNSFPDLKIN